jgi:hypothetical protein
MATISGSTVLTIADAAGVEVTDSFTIQPNIDTEDHRTLEAESQMSL